MQKIDLGQALQILANVAVVAGIIFLAFELRQTNSSIRSASVQAVTNSTGEALRLLAADDDLGSIRRRGNEDYASLDADEAERYQAWYRQFWLGFQNNYIQYKIGALDPDMWNSYARIICQNIGVSGARTTWPDHASVLDVEFVDLVESCEAF
jgi:hypothetical protein